MEYTEGMYKQYEPTADKQRVIFVKEFGDKWMNVDCRKSDVPEICEKKTKAVYEYSVELLKTKAKVDKCFQLIKGIDDDPDSSNSVNFCINSVESLTKSMVDKYYHVFKELDKI